MSIPTAKPRRTRARIELALLAGAVALAGMAAPARAEGWLSVAIVHPAFEDAARERGLERRASECVTRPADPANRKPDEPALLHCVEVLTHEPESFYTPGFVIVGAGPFPGRDCLYAYLHGWLYQNDFLSDRLVEYAPGGFRNAGRDSGPRDWIETPVCR